MNIVPNEFKIDSKPFNMLSSNEYEMAEYKSDDAVIENSSVVRIQVKDISTFTNLFNSYLEVRFNITETNGVAFGAEKITLVNNAMSLFSRCVLRIQNQIVETIDEQHLCAIIKGLLHYSQDYSESSASNQFYYKDTGSALDGSADAQRAYNHDAVAGNALLENGLNITENPVYNKGFIKRHSLTLGSAENTAIIPLSAIFGFCSIDRVMTGNTISVEFTRSLAEDHLIRQNGVNNGKVLFKKMSLWCPRILPSPEVELSLKASLGGGVVSHYKYPVFNGYISDNLSTQAGSSTFRVITQSERMVQVFVMLRRGSLNQELSKVKTRNEFNELEVRVNGKTMPSRRYDNLQNSEGKSRAYFELLNYLRKGSDYSSGIQLSRSEWENSSIFSFDTSNQPENWAKSPTTLEVVSNLTASANGETRNYLVVVVSERNATISYSGSQPVVTIV